MYYMGCLTITINNFNHFLIAVLMHIRCVLQAGIIKWRHLAAECYML